MENKHLDCICGTKYPKGSNTHNNNCKVRKTFLEKIENDKQKIINQYKKVHLIEDIKFGFPDDSSTLSEKMRSLFIRVVRKMLTVEGVYNPYSKEAGAIRYAKSEKTNMEKYGVKNYGELKTAGRSVLNKLPYKKISYLTDRFQEYKNDVERLTKSTVAKMKQLPKYCEYTGIQFADEEGATNPNDPRKRTVDHTVPVIIGYLNYVPAEKMASIHNLKFCLRYVNSLKGNTTLESFIPIATQIREVFINEGYESKSFDAEVRSV